MKVQLRQPKVEYPVFEMNKESYLAVKYGRCCAHIPCKECPFCIFKGGVVEDCGRPHYIKAGFTLEEVE